LWSGEHGEKTTMKGVLPQGRTSQAARKRKGPLPNINSGRKKSDGRYAT